MMQEKGAQDEVKGPGRKGEAEGVGQQFGFRGSRDIHGVVVGASDRGIWKRLSYHACGVSRCRSYIEQGELLQRLRSRPDQLPNRRVPPKLRVDPNQIRQVFLRLLRICTVQQLWFDKARTKHR